jgi:hypothetical protein
MSARCVTSIVSADSVAPLARQASATFVRRSESRPVSPSDTPAVA